MPTFRAADIGSTTTVMVGYMTKPSVVTSLLRDQGLFIHVNMSLDWVSRALLGAGRCHAPLQGYTLMIDRLMAREFGAAEVNTSALADVDPMDELHGDLQGAVAEGDMLESSRKRSRKRLTIADQEFVTSVRLVDVVDEMFVFQKPERERVEAGVLRILVQTNRRRMIYVLSCDLDLCMLVCLRQTERMGVPHIEVPEGANDRALADAPEWFDAVTSRWHVRVPNTDIVLVSEAVRRTGFNGVPLESIIFLRLKKAALAGRKASAEYLHPVLGLT